MISKAFTEQTTKSEACESNEVLLQREGTEATTEIEKTYVLSSHVIALLLKDKELDTIQLPHDVSARADAKRTAINFFIVLYSFLLGETKE